MNRTLLAFVVVISASFTFAQAEDTTLEGSEVYGEIVTEDDSALADDIFGMEGGDFISDNPPPEIKPAETMPTETPNGGSSSPVGKFTVQVFATYSMGKAGEIESTVKSKIPSAETFIVKENSTYKVRVGAYGDRDDADGMREALKRAGFHDAWVVTR